MFLVKVQDLPEVLVEVISGENIVPWRNPLALLDNQKTWKIFQVAINTYKKLN